MIYCFSATVKLNIYKLPMFVIFSVFFCLFGVFCVFFVVVFFVCFFVCFFEGGGGCCCCFVWFSILVVENLTTDRNLNMFYIKIQPIS